MLVNTYKLRYLLNQIMLKKKMIIIGLVAQLIISNNMFVTEVYAATTTQKVTTQQSTSKKNTQVKVISKTLSIRRGASSKKKVIVKVKKGTKLTLLGNLTGSWVKVEYKGKIGYVFNEDSKCLKKVSTTNAEDVAIKNVIQAIDKISSKVSLDDKKQVTKARAAYDKLSSSAKKKVTNLSKLKKAEKTIATLNNKKDEEVIPSPDGVNNNAGVDIPQTDGVNNNAGIDIPTPDEGNNNAGVDIPSIDVGNNDEVVVIPPISGGGNIEPVIPSLDGTNEKAKKLSDKISKLNKDISLSDRAYIESVRKEYSDSEVEVKKLITNITILKKAESRLQVLLHEQSLADNIIARINGLDKEVTLADASRIEEIRNDYENLPVGSKALVYNINVLKELETKLSNLKNEYAKAEKAVESYLDELAKLPEASHVKLSDKVNVVFVRNQYEQLNALAKDMISQEKNQKLVDLENVIKALEIKEQDEANAQYVEELIQNLDKSIVYQDYSLIKEARSQYNRLSPYGQSLVGNLEILERAERAFAEVFERVSNVVNLINKIPHEVTLEDKSYIVSVREAYEQLSSDEKQAIANTELSILIYSEEKIERLETISKHEVLSNYSKQVKSLPSIEEISIKDKELIIELKKQYYLIDESLRFAVGEEFNFLCELEARIELLESQL